MKAYNVTEIPLKFESAVAITAMKVLDDMIYVGLTGGDAILIALDPRDNAVSDTGFRFPHKGNDIMNKIHNSLVIANGKCYIGHGSNINMDKWLFPSSFDGGHLYSYEPKSKKTIDLGLASACSTVHAMAGNDDLLFGYGIPDNHLFSCDLKTGEITDFGNINGHDYPNHNFGCAGRKAFGAYIHPQQSTDDRFFLGGSYLMVYDHDKKEIELTDEMISCGATQGEVGVDAWLTASNGKLYGGCNDGVLVEVDPDTHTVRELGKPRPGGGPRMPSLAEQNGKVFGTSGWPIMGLFSYDMTTGKMEDYGLVTTDYPKMCYFHGMVALPDGSVFVGETDGNRPHVYRMDPK